MNQGSNNDLLGVGAQFHPNEQLVTPNTQHITRRSTNVVNTIANMTHRPSTVNPTATAQKEDTGPGPQQDFQNGEAYNAMERWYKEHPSQQPWNGLSTGGIGDRK